MPRDYFKAGIEIPAAAGVALIMLTSQEHQVTQRHTSSARTSAAAVRRAANRQRVSGAVVLAATDTAGHTYVLVLCPQKEPGRA